MITVILTSSRFDGEVEFVFNHNQLLISMEHRAIMEQAAHKWLLEKMPLHYNQVKELLDKTETLKATEIKREISFEDFWSKYDHKAMSSKKKALTKWKNMGKAQRIRAFNYITIYFASIPQGVAKKYAETYLNSEIWEK